MGGLECTVIYIYAVLVFCSKKERNKAAKSLLKRDYISKLTEYEDFEEIEGVGEDLLHSKLVQHLFSNEFVVEDKQNIESLVDLVSFSQVVHENDNFLVVAVIDEIFEDVHHLLRVVQIVHHSDVELLHQLFKYVLVELVVIVGGNR